MKFLSCWVVEVLAFHGDSIAKLPSSQQSEDGTPSLTRRVVDRDALFWKTPGDDGSTEEAEGQMFPVGSAALIDGRHGVVDWTGVPRLPFVTVRFDDGTSSGVVALADLTGSSGADGDRAHLQREDVAEELLLQGHPPEAPPPSEGSTTPSSDQASESPDWNFSLRSSVLQFAQHVREMTWEKLELAGVLVLLSFMGVVAIGWSIHWFNMQREREEMEFQNEVLIAKMTEKVGQAPKKVITIKKKRISQSGSRLLDAVQPQVCS
mmetsp:Transcript_100236/g.230134  ORF Transcript_100236/g.230134 Transcript_100236/m.230134 type:complete len:264 (-) Transcript_100236:49-840(-)